MKRVIVLLTVIISVFLAACDAGGGGTDQSAAQQDQISSRAKKHATYLPKNDVERNNYEKAQRLYDDPTAIIWCTAFPQNPTANAITVPVAGKLTSSTTSIFAGEHADWSSEGGGAVLPSRSVDGLYHPNPPQYRYGFTPGGQYVDFFNMPTLCTTAPLKFQRQSVKVALDTGLNQANKRAQKALKRGDKKGAQQILEAAAGQ